MLLECDLQMLPVVPSPAAIPGLIDAVCQCSPAIGHKKDQHAGSKLSCQFITALSTVQSCRTKNLTFLFPAAEACCFAGDLWEVPVVPSPVATHGPLKAVCWRLTAICLKQNCFRCWARCEFQSFAAPHFVIQSDSCGMCRTLPWGALEMDRFCNDAV